MRYALCGAVAAALLLGARPAAAAGPADEAAAAALFGEAKQLAAAGDWEHACPKFVEAQRLFPTTGTLLNIGNCYEKVGKLASAWGAFKQAELSARDRHETERQAEAVRRAQAIEGSLSKLTIAVGTTERLPGMEVRRDGEPVGEGQWGAAVPIDAGEHDVQVSAPGYRPWSTKVTVLPKVATAMVAVPRLVPEVKEAPAELTWWSAQRIAGVSVGGAGVVGLVVGAVFGARAISKNDESKAQCSPVDPSFCNDTGVALRHEAKTAATVSTAAIVVGGALVAGGVVLVLTATTAKAGDTARVELAPQLGRLGGGVTLSGRW